MYMWTWNYIKQCSSQQENKLGAKIRYWDLEKCISCVLPQVCYVTNNHKPSWYPKSIFLLTGLGGQLHSADFGCVCLGFNQMWGATGPPGSVRCVSSCSRPGIFSERWLRHEEEDKPNCTSAFQAFACVLLPRMSYVAEFIDTVGRHCRIHSL